LSTNNFSGELTEIPGIGNAASDKLAKEAGITNTHMLIGKYLMMKGPDTVDEAGNMRRVDTVEHNDRFWYFLKDCGINAHRSAIVRAIAEKMGQHFGGIYDPSIYEDDDDDE